jgi:hypothetical protein
MLTVVVTYFGNVVEDEASQAESNTSRSISQRQIVESIARRCVSVLLGERGQFRFPSVLLHPPPLVFESSASYGEMSRRSGEAAKADNHSDMSPHI